MLLYRHVIKTSTPTQMRTLQKHALFVLVALAVQPSSAMNIDTYDRMRKEGARSDARALLRVHVGGVGEGLEWANAYLEREGVGPLFCAPRELNLNADNYVQFVDEALSKDRQSYSSLGLPIAAILTHALRSKLACSKPR